MNTKFEEITIRQFNLMKHAVGLDTPKSGPGLGVYKAYRNYFCTRENDVDWEKLVELGAAIRQISEPCVYYYVSEEGLKLMENILGFKIVESD